MNDGIRPCSKPEDGGSPSSLTKGPVEPAESYLQAYLASHTLADSSCSLGKICPAQWAERARMQPEEQPHHLRLCNLTQTSPCPHLPFPCPKPASDGPSEAPGTVVVSDASAAAVEQLLQGATGRYRCASLRHAGPAEHANPGRSEISVSSRVLGDQPEAVSYQFHTLAERLVAQDAGIFLPNAGKPGAHNTTCLGALKMQLLRVC